MLLQSLPGVGVDIYSMKTEVGGSLHTDGQTDQLLEST